MALGATVTSAVTQTTISSSAYNTNISNINAVETPTFTKVTQTAGTQETGFCGAEQSNSVSSAATGGGVNFKTTMTNTPSGVTLTVLTHGTAGTESGATFRTYGFFFQYIATGTGASFSECSYVTIGN